jgi:DNA-binding transcriptional ArsR family regulator
MVNYNDTTLNGVFAALADPTRRGILAALAGGSEPVSALAEPFGMSLPGFMKHLRILEDAGLVEREKAGRVVTCTLSAEPLRDAAAWIAHYRQFWDARLDALARYLEKENDTWSPPQKNPRSTSSAASKPPRKKSGTRSRSRKR